MPTYEYQCPDGHVFDKFQKMTDKPRTKCPVCGKTATRRISGGAGLVFKGSGFYITDYGKDGKGPRKNEPEKSAADKSGAEPKSDRSGKADGSAKVDAAPAPKSESKPGKPPSGKAAPE